MHLTRLKRRQWTRFVILSRSSLHLLMALKFVATPSSKILVLKQLALALADDLWSIFGQFIAPNSWRSTISIHALSSQFSVQQSSSTKLIEFVGAADVEVREASAVAGGRGGFRWRWCRLPCCYACGIKVVQQSTISYLRWLNLVCKLFCIWPWSSKLVHLN